jgi:hypothetical protein
MTKDFRSFEFINSSLIESESDLILFNLEPNQFENFEKHYKFNILIRIFFFLINLNLKFFKVMHIHILSNF